MHATTANFPIRRISASFVIAAVVAMSGCAAAGNSTPKQAPDSVDGAVAAAAPAPAAAPAAASAPRAGSRHYEQLPADSEFQRFIVKYRDDTAPGRDPDRARERLSTMQEQSGVQLEWLRRLGVGADVFKAAQPLDRKAAAALMDRFSANPEVEYIEVDGILTIRTGVDVPPVKPLK